MDKDKDVDIDIDDITYEEYELVPLAPMDHTSIPEEMKEFMSMCCMMGMMPMSNLMNPIQRILGANEFSDEKESLNKKNEISNVGSRSNQRNISNRYFSEEDRFNPNIEDDYEVYSYGKIDKVVDLIEKNNPALFKFLEKNDIPYDRARKLIKRVVRLTLMYCV